MPTSNFKIPQYLWTQLIEIGLRESELTIYQRWYVNPLDTRICVILNKSPALYPLWRTS